MQYCTSVITLNEVYEIPIDAIKKWHIANHLDDGLPYGYVDFQDRTGDLFAAFEHFQVGASVDITVVNLANMQKRVFPTYRVLKIENDFAIDTSWMAGVVRIWYGHPWFLYKDMTNHAYKPKNIGEQIKDILKDETRGIKFNDERPAPPPNNDFPQLYTDDMDKNFDRTDDTGKFTRYKIAESDWDFIKNKLLPYTAIGQLPAHFYTDDSNDMFYLKSFRNLYKQKPKIVFHQKEEVLQEENNLKRLQDNIRNNNIDLNTGHFIIQSANMVINDFNLIKEIYPSFYIENLEMTTFLKGSKRLANKLRPRSGVSFGNVLPIDAVLASSINGTDAKLIHNRQLIDGLFLLFQTSKELDKMFSLNVVTYFNGHVITVGNTAEIFLAPVEMPNGKKTHWMNGKWLITGVEHFMADNNPRLIFTNTTIIRPSFIGTDTKTSLQSLPLLYEN